MNKDLINKGPAASDLTVILSGTETISHHFDGYILPNTPEGHFSSFSTGPRGPNTALVWDDFWDGQDTTIDTNQTIHIGWTTVSGPSGEGQGNIKDMYWTDPLGRRLPGSIVYNMTTKWTYTTSGLFTAVFHNVFSPEGLIPKPLTVGDLQFAVVSDEIPLAQLNLNNALLVGLFAPVPGGRNFEVGVGESVQLPLSLPVSPGNFVVFKYSVDAEGSAAQSLDFVQIQAVVPEPSSYLLLGTGILGLLGYITGRRKLGFKHSEA